jgi:gamma-glutamyl-gamma-aminobutyrate hydrolase PuuD
MVDDPRFKGYRSYIMTSYVDFLQSAGARIVPLVLYEDEAVTKDKLSKLNGVLFPGGDGDYFFYGKMIYEAIKKYNDDGIYYPMWGTCLGYEDMAIWQSDKGNSTL